MGEVLFRSRFFCPRNGQAWRYYLANTITEFPYVLKSMWQRARRGWADCDVWSIDSWFQQVVPEMLEQLAETKHGTPAHFFPKGLLEEQNQLSWIKDRTGAQEERLAEVDGLVEIQHKRWEMLLQQMATDLRTHQRFWDDVVYEELYDKSSIKEFAQKEVEAENRVKVGLMAFYEYFYSLWD